MTPTYNVKIPMSKNPDKSSPFPYLPRVKKSVMFEPDLLNYIDEKVRQRKWGSCSHAINFLIAEWIKRHAGKEFRIVW